MALLLVLALGVPCTGPRLSGTFTVVRGSAGAGNIVYALRLRNVSRTSCTVTGIAGVTLLDRRGRRLPTHATRDRAGTLTAVLVTLAPGQSAVATARFSPDVPGLGEPVSGRRCEPVAASLLVRLREGGTIRTPIRPPTPVCEHGGMSWRVLTRRR